MGVSDGNGGVTWCVNPKRPSRQPLAKYHEGAKMMFLLNSRGDPK
jgi:hypothetical protein